MPDYITFIYTYVNFYINMTNIATIASSASRLHQVNFLYKLSNKYQIRYSAKWNLKCGKIRL